MLSGQRLRRMSKNGILLSSSNSIFVLFSSDFSSFIEMDVRGNNNMKNSSGKERVSSLKFGPNYLRT